MPIQTLQDYDNLIQKCRQKTLKKSERYTVLELVLEMILQCGVSAQEIPYIWIQDMTDTRGKIRNSFPSFLYNDSIDIKPIKSQLENYLKELKQWNLQLNRNDPRFFPQFPRRQAIERSLKVLDDTAKVEDIHALAKKNGFHNRRVRKLERRDVSVDGFMKTIDQMKRIEEQDERRKRAKEAIGQIQRMKLLDDRWNSLEKDLQKYL